MKYIVSIPLTGAMHIEVSASTAEEAEDRAWEVYNENGESAGEVEWELVNRVNEGNVSHAYLNEIEITRVREQ